MTLETKLKVKSSHASVDIFIGSHRLSHFWLKLFLFLNPIKTCVVAISGVWSGSALFPYVSLNKRQAIIVIRCKYKFVQSNATDAQQCTRGIWKVLSMVFYHSKQFINPIMFGIISKSYLSSLL